VFSPYFSSDQQYGKLSVIKEYYGQTPTPGPDTSILAVAKLPTHPSLPYAQIYLDILVK
jgi:hypothetical protein